MARFNITLPDILKDQLKKEAEQLNKKPSTLIAQYVEEHYGASTADCEERLEALQKKYDAAEQQADTEVSALKRQLQREQGEARRQAASQDARLQELQHELEAATTTTKKVERELTNKDDNLRRLEQELQGVKGQLTQERDQETQKAASKDTVIKELQQELENAKTRTTQLERQLAASTEELQHYEEDAEKADAEIQRLHHELTTLEASKATVVQGVQSELAVAQNNVKNLSEQLQMHKQIIHNLEEDKKQLLHDKDQLQKQIMVMLPAPKQSWWSRVFGRRKKEQEAQA